MPKVIAMSSNAPLRHPLRFLAAVALVVAGVAHIPVTPEHLHEAPYMGVAFVTFTVVALAAAVMVLARDSRLAYALVMLLCAAAVATYAATRLIAFPQLGDDVGNWGETLGVVSIVSETIALVLAAAAVGTANSGLRAIRARH